MKHSVPSALIFATDVARDTIALARYNTVLADLEVEFLEGDLFAPLPETLRGGVDLVVANPPCVADDEVAALPREV